MADRTMTDPLNGEDVRTPLEVERYEKVRARVGISAITSERRFRERNAVAASTGSLNGQRKVKRGNWAFGGIGGGRRG